MPFSTTQSKRIASILAAMALSGAAVGHAQPSETPTTAPKQTTEATSLDHAQIEQLNQKPLSSESSKSSLELYGTVEIGYSKFHFN